MSIGGLTSSAGLKLGPVILETLVKHYYRRIKTANKIAATTSSDGVVHDGNQVGSTLNDNLRQEELLYDEVFSIAKVSITHVSPPTQPHRSLPRVAWLVCTGPFVFGCFLRLSVTDACDLISPSPRCSIQDFMKTASQ